VTDGMTVSRMAADLESTLNGQVVAELEQRAPTQDHRPSGPPDMLDGTRATGG
jgi:hypothetical protein